MDEQARDGASLRVVVHVVHARHTGDQSLDGVVRTGHPGQQLGHRQSDGDQYAVREPRASTPARQPSASISSRHRKGTGRRGSCSPAQRDFR
jgi:hypothetical protein